MLLGLINIAPNQITLFLSIYQTDTTQTSLLYLFLAKQQLTQWNNT